MLNLSTCACFIYWYALWEIHVCLQLSRQ